MKQDIQGRRNNYTKPRCGLLLTLVVLLAAVITYAGLTLGPTTRSTEAAQPQPTSVHIVRIPGNEPNFQIVPLDRTIVDTSQVQHLYQTILSLPANCGCAACALTPEAYMMTFYLNSQVILTVRAGFCGEVDLDRGNPNDTAAFRYRRQGSLAFWAELAHMLGIPQSQLEPYLD